MMAWKTEFLEKYGTPGIYPGGMLKWIENNAGRIMRARQLSKMTRKQRLEAVTRMNKARKAKRG